MHLSTRTMISRNPSSVRSASNASSTTQPSLVTSKYTRESPAFACLWSLASNGQASSCHRTPADQPKKYDCVLCKVEFECTQTRKEHVATHADPVTGQFACTHCKKRFDEFAGVRKHIRAFHSDKQYPCSVCQKASPCSFERLQPV